VSGGGLKKKAQLHTSRLSTLSAPRRFNRINIEVLSVVSAQIRAIQNALNYGRDTVDIGRGSEIRVNKKVGIFITMNPGYAGRTELPDNRA
jgi:dynein heavy chain, axonemal